MSWILFAVGFELAAHLGTGGIHRNGDLHGLVEIDFYGVDLDKPVKITVPVEFTGVARGTKVGGKLETYREQIQLMAKPLDMPAKVTIDISGMDVGTTIQIADVKLPEGVKAAYDNNYAIVSVLMPGGDDAAAE